MFFFFIPALIIALFLESAVTTIPLVLVVLLCLTVVKRDGSIFPIAFLVGILLDMMTVRTLGMSSLFFTLVTLLILLYQRKYEITSYLFIGSASFLGSVVYIIFFQYGGWFAPSLWATVIALILFGVVKKSGFLKQV